MLMETLKMTDKDLIKNALIIIQQELQISPELAWHFMNNFKSYKEWKDNG